MLHYLSPDEKDRESFDVGKILSGTLTVTIVAVLLLALASCISCQSKYAHTISSVSEQRLNALVILFSDKQTQKTHNHQLHKHKIIVHHRVRIMSYRCLLQERMMMWDMK